MAQARSPLARVSGARKAPTPQQRARGAANLPANPTGRLVVEGMTTHWCPAEGTVWTCPDCGVRFVRDEDRRGEQWRQAV